MNKLRYACVCICFSAFLRGAFGKEELKILVVIILVFLENFPKF